MYLYKYGFLHVHASKMSTAMGIWMWKRIIRVAVIMPRADSIIKLVASEYRQFF